MNTRNRTTDLRVRLATLAASALLLTAATATVSFAKDEGDKGKPSSNQAQSAPNKGSDGSGDGEKAPQHKTDPSSSQPASASPAHGSPQAAPAKTSGTAGGGSGSTAAPAAHPTQSSTVTSAAAAAVPTTGVAAGSPLRAATASAAAQASTSASTTVIEAPVPDAPPAYAQGVLGVATTVTPSGPGLVSAPSSKLASAAQHFRFGRELLIPAWLLVNALVIIFVRRHRSKRGVSSDFVPISLGTHNFKVQAS